MDIHLEKGMHCVDCHFVQDIHGNTKLYGEVRAAIEIQCIDCHGTANERANAADLRPGRAHAGQRRPRPGGAAHAVRQARGSKRSGDKLIQNSMVEEGPALGGRRRRPTRSTPGNRHYNEKVAAGQDGPLRADDGQAGLGRPAAATGRRRCAHANENMSCIACHSSWNPSCFGCHLPQKANKKMPQSAQRGRRARATTSSYNFQTLRDDVYMLARDGDVTGNRIGPARSSCAIHVGSYNSNRESIYVQQQTISAEGM